MLILWFNTFVELPRVHVNIVQQLPLYLKSKSTAKFRAWESPRKQITNLYYKHIILTAIYFRKTKIIEITTEMMQGNLATRSKAFSIIHIYTHSLSYTIIFFIESKLENSRETPDKHQVQATFFHGNGKRFMNKSAHTQLRVHSFPEKQHGSKTILFFAPIFISTSLATPCSFISSSLHVNMRNWKYLHRNVN